MNSLTAVEEEFPGRSKCWCCGGVEELERLVHLGNHPEVAIVCGRALGE